MDTTCLLSPVLWFWARGSFCVDSEGKIQDYSVPFHLLFSCLQLFRPCPHSCLTCLWWFDDRKTSQTLLCMLGCSVPHFSFSHNVSHNVPKCPTMSHNVLHPHAMTPSHLCTHYWMASPPLPSTNRQRQRQRQRSEQRDRQRKNPSRWQWEFEKGKTCMIQNQLNICYDFDKMYWAWLDSLSAW